MIDTSLPFPIRPDRPVDSLIIDILSHVDAALRGLGIDYFVAGALARDLILLHVFGKDTGRATRDVDLGICIDNWGQLDALKACLIHGGKFFLLPRITHRLFYRPRQEFTGIPLDLLPFGGVERADATIAWPPGMEIVMNVVGFAEARAAALQVEVAAGFVVPVTSLPALAVLKLIAWRDRHLHSEKDAIDFLLIARHYYDAGNLDRLYETESALLQEVGFDPELAGAMLLGKDAAAICQASTAQLIMSILVDPQWRQRLIDQLLRTTLLSGDGTASVRLESYLDAFHHGFRLMESGHVRQFEA